jgi:predicted 2-oxoglutarate/Fe(II)-dependent dioxygenase YbiX
MAKNNQRLPQTTPKEEEVPAIHVSKRIWSNIMFLSRILSNKINE